VRCAPFFTTLDELTLAAARLCCLPACTLPSFADDARRAGVAATTGLLLLLLLLPGMCLATPEGQSSSQASAYRQVYCICCLFL
jgi:hypothetical protein